MDPNLNMTLTCLHRLTVYVGRCVYILFKVKLVCAVAFSLQDEPSTLQLLKKHLVLEQTIEDYAETIGLLSQQCRQLLEMGHPDW